MTYLLFSMMLLVTLPIQFFLHVNIFVFMFKEFQGKIMLQHRYHCYIFQ